MGIRTFRNIELKKHDKESRVRTFVISDESVDRRGTSIKMDGWELDNYAKNGIVAYQHQTSGGMFSESNPDHIIGKGKVWKEEGRLMGSVEFEPADINPLAEKILKKVDFGSLKTTSVGFNPLDGRWGDEKRDENKDTFYYRKQDLLEFSIVNIPSNPNATQRNSEEQDEFIKQFPKEKQLKEEKKGMSSGNVRKMKARYLSL